MKRITREISRLMGQNLRKMRKERGWSQEELADFTSTDRRYVSAMENGRGIGKNMLDRLCQVFGVEEEAFTLQTMPQKTKPVDTLPRVIRMILEELENMPEYDQLRLLAGIVEKRYKKLEGEVAGQSG